MDNDTKTLKVGDVVEWPCQGRQKADGSSTKDCGTLVRIEVKPWHVLMQEDGRFGPHSVQCRRCWER